MANWLQGTIIDNHQWNARLFSLRIEAPLGEFKAGQFVRVALDIDGERVARPYSLVNAPHEEVLEIFFNIVPEGPLSPALAKLKKGDSVFVSDKPAGFLTVDEVPPAKNLWLLATGTALGPFLSVLKTDSPWQQFEKIILAYSVRSKDELAYVDVIDQLLEKHADQLVFVPCITREQVEGAIHGRVTAAISDGSLEATAGIGLSPENSHVFLCGNSAMITEVTELLEAREMRRHRRREPGHIATEKYH